MTGKAEFITDTGEFGSIRDIPIPGYDNCAMQISNDEFLLISGSPVSLATNQSNPDRAVLDVVQKVIPQKVIRQSSLIKIIIASVLDLLQTPVKHVKEPNDLLPYCRTHCSYGTGGILYIQGSSLKLILIRTRISH